MTMQINVLGYTYNIYNSGYNTEMINKQRNVGDPLETLGGLYRGIHSIEGKFSSLRNNSYAKLNVPRIGSSQYTRHIRNKSL